MKRTEKPKKNKQFKRREEDDKIRSKRKKPVAKTKYRHQKLMIDLEEME